MGLDILEFRTDPHRTKIGTGQELAVALVAQWDPFDQGGTEDVELTAADPAVTITPPKVSFTLPAAGDVVTMTFRIKLSATASTITRVAAKGKFDHAAFFIQIEA